MELPLFALLAVCRLKTLHLIVPTYSSTFLRPHSFNSMDLGLAAAEAASTQPAAGRQPAAKRAAVGNTANDLVRIISILCKLTLNNAQYTRILRSLMLDVWQLPAEHPLVEAIKKSNQQFDQAAKTFNTPDARRQTLGERHVYAWNAVLTWLKNYLEEMSPQDLPKITEYMTKYQAFGVRALAQQIKFTRIKKVFSQEYKNLEINIVPGTESAVVQEALYSALQKSTRVTRLPGVPPLGDLERKVQTWLEENGFSQSAQTPAA